MSSQSVVHAANGLNKNDAQVFLSTLLSLRMLSICQISSWFAFIGECRISWCSLIALTTLVFFSLLLLLLLWRLRLVFSFFFHFVSWNSVQPSHMRIWKLLFSLLFINAFERQWANHIWMVESNDYVALVDSYIVCQMTSAHGVVAYQQLAYKNSILFCRNEFDIIPLLNVWLIFVPQCTAKMPMKATAMSEKKNRIAILAMPSLT